MRGIRVGKRQGRWPLLVAVVLLVAAFMSVSNRSPGPLSAAMIGVPGPISVGDSIAGSAAAAGNVDTYPLFVPTPLVARRGF